MGFSKGDLVQIKLNDDFDEDEFGDRFIREARMHREEEQRLRYIDSRLKELNDETISRAALTNDELSIDYASTANRVKTPPMFTPSHKKK